MKNFTDPKMLMFLAETLNKHEWLRLMDFPWEIKDKAATTSFNTLFWATGIIQPDLDELLEIVQILKDEHGWKRYSTAAIDGPAWILHAYIENEEGYRIQFSFTRDYDQGRPDGVSNHAICFFAPPYPPPPKRWIKGSPSAKRWLTACDEITKKARNHEF